MLTILFKILSILGIVLLILLGIALVVILLVLSDFLQSCRKADGRGILDHRESKMVVRSIADELRLS